MAPTPEEPIRVQARRVAPDDDSLAADVRRAEHLAQLMDAKFELGGVKFGLDALLGLLPAAGDAVSFGIGLYPVYLARKHKLGPVIIARMLANLGVDFIAGIVPLAGDVLDVFVKANLKNVALLKRAVEKRTPLL